MKRQLRHVIKHFVQPAVILLLVFCTSLAITDGRAAAVAIDPKPMSQQDTDDVFRNTPLFDENDTDCSADDVNNVVAGGGSVTQLKGADDKEKIFNYFLARGLKPHQAAGFMGNIQVESGFQIDNQENSRPWPQGGWGLVQWTGSRRIAIAKALADNGLGELYNSAYADGNTPADKKDDLMLFELNYVWQELTTTRKIAYEPLIKAATVTDATDAILVYFESPFNPKLDIPNRKSDPRWIKQMANRDPLSQAIFDDMQELGSGSGGAQAVTATSKTVIAIDPGHGAEIDQYIDGVSGLADRETNNLPEGNDVLTVAQRVKAALEKDGYEVILLRTNGTQPVTKRVRVDKAVQAKAALAVSLHSTPGSVNDVWSQKVGTYREYNGKRVTLTNQAVASKSQTYANAIAQAREAAEGHPIDRDTNNSVQAGSFNRPDVPSKGNISLVQLWGQDIPWVYNEIGQDSGTSLSEGLKQKYTDGLVKGIEAAVPAAGVGDSDGSGPCKKNTPGGGTTGSGDANALQAKTLEYAWPTYRGRILDSTPGWQKVIDTYRAKGKYIGGNAHPGIDCGGFVTNLVVDSGFDPTYNHGALVKNGAGFTSIQYDWLRANWRSLGNAGKIDPATLKSGDVAIRDGHTFIYVGKFKGFSEVIASASLDERAPMADRQSPTDADFEWFRKK